ncbi:hypothetical protein SK128_010418 [Halocaridina rubra]|uniref:Uncharacterized protein n=1 Tax=Halocaridina rubra TaxID=373956 RepID=A0AAN8WLR9_HALRR
MQEEYGPKDNQPEDDEEGAEEGGILTPLSMDHMQGVFFILVLGWFASLLVFATERIIKREK